MFIFTQFIERLHFVWHVVTEEKFMWHFTHKVNLPPSLLCFVRNDPEELDVVGMRLETTIHSLTWKCLKFHTYVDHFLR